MSDQLTSALNLMRRMPPSSMENSLAGLIELTPQLTDELLNHVDQPLKLEKDSVTGKDFILCDYNRDGDSYRSPWSNKYFPALDDGFLPTQKLRQMEIEANTIFETYKKLYFEGGHSSVYFFNTEEKDDKAFGACFLVHKDVEVGARGLSTGWWDSIHVFDVADGGKADQFKYTLTSTVLVSMAMKNDKVGDVDLSGSMTQQVSQTSVVSKDRPHMTHMGKMLEDQELKIRNMIENVYIQKTREVISGMRSTQGARDKAWEDITKSLNNAVKDYGSKRAVDG